ncbi:MAG: hypothetical protein B7Y70_02160 [Rhizobiales bacterium 35-68-8]|nr:MAG: hypothetical protein B7Y70_02160 [Rhizobiales bacterium 35-68-8]
MTIALSEQRRPLWRPRFAFPPVRLPHIRLTLGRKLGAVLSMFALLALGVAGFGYYQISSEQQRGEQIEMIWNGAFQSQNLARAIEHTVVAANAVYTATDKAAAREKLHGLESALADVTSAADPFFSAFDARLEPMQKVRLQNQIREFIAYQKETVEMGLTISPQAALLQASEEGAIRSREQMVKAVETLGREVLTGLTVARTQVERERGDAQIALLAVPAIGLLLALAAAIWMTTTQIQRPLARLKDAMTALAANNLTVDVPFANRADEIGEMAASIKVFRQALLEKATADAELKARSVAEHARLEQLADAARAFEGDALKMTATVRDATRRLSSAAKSMVATSDRTETEAEVVSGAAAASARAVDGIADNATELSNASHAIGERARATSDIAGEALLQTHRTSATASELVHAVGTIGAVVDAISAIAAQTNLLALNATIEAARAGERGRGFAVVASEVKVLAQQTASATAEVTKQIAAIRTASNQTAGAVDAIGATIGRMSEYASEVAEAATRQGQSVQEMATGLAEAAEGCQTVSGSIASVRASVASQGAHFDEVESLAADLEDRARQLGDSVDTFLACVRSN